MPGVQMNGFTDIHTHVLPGADDGAQDVAEALKLVRMAWGNGTRTMFFTPHYRGRFKNTPPMWHRENFDIFCQLVHSELPDMRLFLGNEIHYEADVSEKLFQGDIMTLNNSRYVLLEFSPASRHSQIVRGVSEILGCGFIPIIAHAERYDGFQSSPTIAREVTGMGALIQLNADSIMGKCGYQTKNLCHNLLKDECVHFIASDAHDITKRPPLLRDCFLTIRKKYAEEYAARVFYENAQAVIENRMV